MDQVIITTGANELPVYVAAKYWGQRLPQAALTLFCSSETEDEAERVLELLGLGEKVAEHRVCCENPYDPKQIEATAASITGEQCVVDFTGGTKVMSFHVMKALDYRVVKTSYLDAKINAVRCADEAEHSGDLRKNTDFRLSLKQLRKLHGAVFQYDGEGSSLLTEAKETLETILSPMGLSDAHSEVKGNSVFVVLGYQLLAVTALGGQVKRAEQKLAAFKALHRARQTGGDHVHAVMLTEVSVTQNDDVRRDVAIDIGGTSPNLHCWTTEDRNQSLSQHFSGLLRGVKWC